MGRSLIDEAASAGHPIVIDDVPDGYADVESGIGRAKPRTLVLIPACADHVVTGVLELGFFAAPAASVMELLTAASESVGVAIRSAQYRERQAELLEEWQVQAEELTQQQEELRAVNDQLEEQTQAAEMQKLSLQATETVLRQKATQLERTSRYKSEFLANMSHELRTPLNSSLILAKLLVDNKEGNLTEKQVRYASSIYSGGNELLMMINDILDLAKIEAGKLDVNSESVSIEHVVRDLERCFEPLASEKGLELTLTVAPDCPDELQTDPQRLQQILTNLVSNAVKFTTEGSVRLIVADGGNGGISFRVQDTGIGIPARHHDVVFEAFRQADGTTNRKFGGTGLGLSICRELADLLGGEISLESEDGRGSIFTLWLPSGDARVAPGDVTTGPPHERPPVGRESAVAESPRRPVPRVDDDRQSLELGDRVVLIVEDDAEFAKIVRELAQELAFRCVVATTAHEGLRLARECDPVAIILDIGLPDGSGLTVLENLKRDPATRHIAVHVVSAHEHQQLAGEMGAVGYAVKPVDRDELADAFRALGERLSRVVKDVLIVEDDTVQRDAIFDLLAADDVRVTATSTATEALQELRARTFDCVVLDLMLPDVSGFDLLNEMAEDDCSFPPVIVYTARELSKDDEQQLSRYSQSIIIKGARSPERLLEEVTLFLHQVETELPVEKQRMLASARDRESVFEGRRILLVEDDVRNIFAFTSVLESKGARVDVARNGHEALERLSEQPGIDLVLMDVMMPEMDGLSATRAIRARELAGEGYGRGTGHLPIIAVTAKAMPNDRQDCLAAGANDYVAKPVDIDQLLSLLRVWMPR